MEPHAHPNYVMEPDGEIHEWTADDTKRFEAALARVNRRLWAARHHAGVQWYTTTADGH